MSIVYRSLSVFYAFFVLMSFNTLAQSNKDKELLSLLDSYPESPSIAVYSQKTKIKIDDVLLSNSRIIVDTNSESAWLNARFEQPLLPVWVSSDYVVKQNNQIKVAVKALNARLLPENGSEKITVLPEGYTSSVFNSKNGFVQINAPAKTVFSIDRKQLEAVPSNLVLRKTIRVNPVLSTLPIEQTGIPKSRQTVQTVKPTQTTLVSDSADHKIAPGDSISLLVFGESDLSKENIRVPESGNVSLPLIGNVNVAGKTTKQIEDEVRVLLSSGYVNNPRLSVSIFSYRPIFIRGAVQNTGAFPYTQGLTVAKALALAGGSLNSAKPEGVNILRDGKVVESQLSLDSQYQVASGDVITIDEEQGIREDESLFIYLHGEVANPGEYRYRKGLTVEKAIVLSGGFTLRASKRKINITRYNNIDENTPPQELKNVKLYTTIMPGDVIKVRASLF